MNPDDITLKRIAASRVLVLKSATGRGAIEEVKEMARRKKEVRV